MKKHTFEIPCYQDRERLIIAFANSGYTVRVVEKQDENVSYPKEIYFVEVSK